MNITQKTWWRGLKIRLFSRGGEFRRNPGQSWTIVLSFLGIGIFVVLSVGYVTYIRSVQNDTNLPSAPSQSALRTADVKSIIETYQQKKRDLNIRLSDHPTFLSPGKGSIPPPKAEIPSPSSSTTTTSVPLP